jgi:hypothetical protein
MHPSPTNLHYSSRNGGVELVKGSMAPCPPRSVMGGTLFTDNLLASTSILFSIVGVLKCVVA